MMQPPSVVSGGCCCAASWRSRPSSCSSKPVSFLTSCLTCWKGDNWSRAWSRLSKSAALKHMPYQKLLSKSTLQFFDQPPNQHSAQQNILQGLLPSQEGTAWRPPQIERDWASMACMLDMLGHPRASLTVLWYEQLGQPV